MDMDMDLDMHDEHYDWAHDAFVKLNATDMDTADLDMDASLSTWSPFATKPTAVPKPPARAAIERHGQITPPEDSISPPATPMPRPTHMLLPAERPAEPPLPTERAPRHRRTSATKPASANPPPSHDPRTLDNATTALNPQPPKRKRGRPKSQSQPLPTDAYNPEGFPFPISTARQSHLEKNRVAAHKCRQRRKEYIDTLEARGREASTKNKQLKENVAILRDEILGLKNEVLRHAGCNFWAVDEYLARCAGDLLGVAGPPPTYSRNSLSFSPLSNSGHDLSVKERSMSIHSLPSRDISNSPDDFDDYFIDNADRDLENSNA